jgi:hypothetical protein
LKINPQTNQNKAFGIQQQFNTDSTRDQRRPEVWLYCTQIETAVKLEKQGLETSRVYVPGLGSRQFNNEWLQPLDGPSVELEVNDGETEVNTDD